MASKIILITGASAGFGNLTNSKTNKQLNKN